MMINHQRTTMMLPPPHGPLVDLLVAIGRGDTIAWSIRHAANGDADDAVRRAWESCDDWSTLWEVIKALSFRGAPRWLWVEGHVSKYLSMERDPVPSKIRRQCFTIAGFGFQTIAPTFAELVHAMGKRSA